jgi:hypothetical protein
MKKLVLTAVASLACLAAFAQGKVSLQVDSLHLVYYDPARTDASLGGQGCSSTLFPAGYPMMADLYAGTSSSSLSLISSTTFSASPGKPNSLSVQIPGVPSGSVFMILQVRDSAGTTPESIWTPAFNEAAAQAAGLHFWGTSTEFSFNLGVSITYPPMWGANGNWPAGTFALDQYGAGSRGGIAVVSLVPEPTTAALAGLAAAALLIFRRRK